MPREPYTVGIRHLQLYYTWHVLQIVLHFRDEQSSRHQFHHIQVTNSVLNSLPW